MSYCEEQLKAAEEKAWKERIKRVNSRLKSCPCCSGKAEVKEGFNTDGRCGYVTVYIECSRCGVIRFSEVFYKILKDGWTVDENGRTLCPFCSIL